jgi:hypothetical protein
LEYFFQLTISGILTSCILIGFIRIYLLKKKNEALLLSMISMLSIGFGFILMFLNGLPFIYGTANQTDLSHAKILLLLAEINIYSGLIFVLISILKFCIWLVKNQIYKN